MTIDEILAAVKLLVNSYERQRECITELANALRHISQRDHKAVSWCDGCASASKALARADEMLSG